MTEAAARARHGSVIRAPAVRAAAALAAWVVVAGGCDPTPSTLVDSFPIALGRAPMGGGLAGDGALVAKAAGTDGTEFDMVVDTGSVASALAGDPAAGVGPIRGGFDLLEGGGAPPGIVRARFRDHELVRMPIAAIGDGSLAPPQGIFGGTLMRGFSLQIRFGETCTLAGVAARCTSMTFWNHVGAVDGFLADAGFAVYRFTLYGGGEYTVDGRSDFLGLRGPLVLPATRLVMRTCAAPRPFVPTATPETAPVCCTANDAATQATGTDLALLLSTGVGPLVLSQSAWDRVARAAALLPAPDAVTLPPLPARTPSLFVATWPDAIPASWSSLPRLAFVDLEVGGNADPGACVELGRARRTEQVSFLNVMDSESRACAQPCDADTREPDKAQSSAAYLELGGSIPVAVVDDNAAFLQALRFDVRPEGPELDGLVGAGVFGRARVELDYVSSQTRMLMSCEDGVDRAECFAAARCPRLPDQSSVHYCFGLGPHKLPASCDPRTCPAR